MGFSRRAGSDSGIVKRILQRTVSRLSPFFFLLLFTVILVSGAYAAVTEDRLLWSHTAQGDVADVAISPDGETIVAADQANYVLSYDRSGNLLWKYQLQVRPLCVAVSTDRQRIAVGSLDGKVTVLNQQGNKEWEYGTNGQIKSVSLAETGMPVAAGSTDYRVSLLDAPGKVIWTATSDGVINGIGISASGDTIAAGSGHNRLSLYNGEGRVLWIVTTPTAVVDVALSDDGRKVAAVTEDYRLAVYSREGTQLWQTTMQLPPVYVAISPEGDYVAAGTLGGQITLYDSGGKQTLTFSTSDKIQGLDLSSGAHRVATGSADYRVSVFEGIPGMPVTPGTTPPATTATPTGEPTPPGPTETATTSPTGDLKVTSIPAGASVSVDGLLAGTTPLTVTALSPGSHSVMISLEGYDSGFFDVYVAARETATLAAELAPLTLPTASGSSLPGAILLGTLACLLAVLGKRRFS